MGSRPWPFKVACHVTGTLCAKSNPIFWFPVDVGVVIWDEMQTCIWPSRCHCHSLSLAPVNPDWFQPSWFCLSGTCSPGWSRTYSRRAVKWLCVCVCVCVVLIGLRATWPTTNRFTLTLTSVPRTKCLDVGHPAPASSDLASYVQTAVAIVTGNNAD